jgi:xanthine dehydrogenase YagS FAD-binding subunit
LQLLRPDSVEAAAAELGNGSVALAGGTDLVPLLRDRIVEAETLVDLSRVVPRGVVGTTIGAGTTLAELEADTEIPQALREACSLAASPQLRAMGTIGGNLLQATRCWYWRLQYPCFLHGGDRCHARQGAHREHAIFGNQSCASAHPSDPAAALLALGATLRTDRRELPLEELYRLPTEDDRGLTALEPGELILELDVPRPEASTYLKSMDRARFTFALVGVGAAGSSRGVRLALAGVAPIPWLLKSPDDLERATPLPGTAFKVDLARPLIRRALEAIGT